MKQMTIKNGMKLLSKYNILARLSILKSKKDNSVKWLKVSSQNPVLSSQNPVSLCEGVMPLPKNTQVEWVGKAEDYQKPFKQKNGQNIIIDDLKKDMNSRDKIKWASQLLNDPRKYV